MLNTDSKGFLVENLNELNKEHSPSIPPGFPRSLLPKELCKAAATEMLWCHSRKQQNLCGYENKYFYICKRERDAILFTRIQEWETEEVRKLGEQERVRRVEELEAKRAGLSEKFE
jgi:hypothetical protein